METEKLPLPNIEPGEPTELVALAVKQRGIRCKILTTGEPVTFRSPTLEVEGEILTVVPKKVWQFKKTTYVSGEVTAERIDVPSLGLTPLKLNRLGVWNPNDEYWGEPDDEIDPLFEPIIKHGSRLEFEMEQVIPGENREDPFDDPILQASEYHGCGADDEAYKIIEKILVEDLRCLDAHAHLGNWQFEFDSQYSNRNVMQAKKHYEIGVRIGELSLGKDFSGLLRWGHIDNRPFLRCMHGYGLCLWRLGELDEARRVFERMLWLNPSDNQGIRFVLHAINENVGWAEFSKEDETDAINFN